MDADLRCGCRFESEHWSESIIYIKSLVGPYKKRTLFYFRDVSSFCTPRKAGQTAEWSGKWNRVYIYIYPTTCNYTWNKAEKITLQYIVNWKTLY